jgi:Lon protease-like protein
MTRDRSLPARRELVNWDGGYSPFVGETSPIPIFPLGNVALFPGVSAPLHIFEPRYRQMMEAALGADRVLGMATVRPDHQADMAGDPAVFPVGCAGTIERYDRLPDGRYNLVLHGTHRFRIVDEQLPEGDRLYRLARVQMLPEAPIDDAAASGVHDARTRVAQLLEDLVVPRVGPEQAKALGRLGALGDAQFANALSHSLGLPVEERQALLEADGPAARIEALEGTLSFHLARMRSTSTAGTDRVH